MAIPVNFDYYLNAASDYLHETLSPQQIMSGKNIWTRFSEQEKDKEEVYLILVQSILLLSDFKVYNLDDESFRKGFSILKNLSNDRLSIPDTHMTIFQRIRVDKYKSHIKQGIKDWAASSRGGKIEAAAGHMSYVLENYGDEVGVCSADLEDFPPVICLMPLKTLCFNNNFITYLPAKINQMIGLKTLILYHNKLEYLPKEIGELKSLEKLDLNTNMLTSIPKEIGQLASLKSLDLGCNKQLTSLPEEIGQLRSLKHLSLSYNPISALPETLNQIPNLSIGLNGTNVPQDQKNKWDKPN